MPRITKRGLRQERILLDEISVREKRTQIADRVPVTETIQGEGGNEADF